MAADAILDLYDEYLPFRLYADYKQGATIEELSTNFSLPVHWVAERIEAARLCIEKQVRLDLLLSQNSNPRRDSQENHL